MLLPSKKKSWNRITRSIKLVNKATAQEIKANEKLQAEKNPQTRVCLAFNLQVLNVPYGENGLIYYSRKLAVYNLTITDLATKDATVTLRITLQLSKVPMKWEVVYFLM